MSGTDYKFEGWLGLDEASALGNMQWGEFEPKPWEETDIDIKIECCGICGSDIHTLRSGWAPTKYPCCVGHEVVGTVVRAGSKVEGDIKVGDRVGVGAQSDSCRNRTDKECKICANSNYNYCRVRHVGTYNGVYLNGGTSYGGYATYQRVPSFFTVKIPDEIPSSLAAPMLCAGVTTYAPLKFHNVGPGKRVGIIGLGGLGHFGVMWAKALGADQVVCVSRSSSKKEDAMKMGATDFIATAEDPEWLNKNRSSLDVILCTASSADMPFNEYLSLLDLDGVFIQVGAPDDGLPQIQQFPLIFNRIKLTGSLIGSPDDIREMFKLAVEQKVQPWVKEIPMKDANQAILDFEAGKPRYRFVLKNEDYTPAATKL